VTVRAGLAAGLVLAVGVALLLRWHDSQAQLDVAVVGDSFMEQSRDQFLAHTTDRKEEAQVSALGGTGVCDWNDQLDEILDERPKALVLSFAGNDLTPCMKRTAAASTPDQTAAEYAEDLDSWVSRFRAVSPRTQIYLVMPPPVAKPEFEANAAAMRAMYQRFVATHPKITLVDVSPELGPDHRFHTDLPCESWEQQSCAPGGTIELRKTDGIHLTPAGGERYARAILAAMDRP
jgi:lysophospholipase L1-like esterase